MPDNPYRGHRFPKEIISECVWLYFRFGVSFRDVEEMVAARGVVVSYETIRCWCDKFGKTYADGLRRRRARTGDKWHLDEFSSRSTALLITSGERLIRTALCSTSLCSHGGIDSRPYVSFAGCCGLRGERDSIRDFV